MISIALARYPEAEAELKKALEIDPDFIPAAVTLADLYRGLGRDAEAEPVLRTAIARQALAPAAHYSLGLWLIRAGRRDEALAELKLAAEQGPTNPQLSYVYAVALSELGNPADAMQILRIAVQRHPYHRDSLMLLATIERGAGLIDAARGHAERLAALEPDNPAVQQLLATLNQ